MADAAAPPEQVLAWDFPIRAFKWTLVALVFMGWLSNKIGHATPAWHKWNGYAILALIMFRLLWGMVGGSTARFANFLQGPRGVIAYLRGVLTGTTGRYLGHNPLGAWVTVVLLFVVGALAVAGLYAADEDRLIISGPLARTVSDGWVDFAARWHHRLFDLLKILVVAHVGANILHQFVKKDPLIRAMATGMKPAADYVDEAEARPGSAVVALACLAAAVVIVFGAMFALGGKPF